MAPDRPVRLGYTVTPLLPHHLKERKKGEKRREKERKEGKREKEKNTCVSAIVHSTQYTVHSTQHTAHSAQRTAHSTVTQ